MIGPNVGFTAQDGALLIAMLDRIERRIENIESRLDHLQEGIATTQLEQVKIESKGNTERLKMYIAMAAVGGAGGSILPKLLELMGIK